MSKKEKEHHCGCEVRITNINPELKKKLMMHSKDNGKSLSHYCKTVLKQHITQIESAKNQIN